AGVIAGSTGSLLKQGAAKLTLTGANTYGGPTTVGDGILALGSSGSVASSSIVVGTISGSAAQFDVSNVSGGFTLAAGKTLSGHGTVVGAMTVTGTIAPGTSAGNLTTGNQTWDA